MYVHVSVRVDAYVRPWVLGSSIYISARAFLCIRVYIRTCVRDHGRADERACELACVRACVPACERVFVRA